MGFFERYGLANLLISAACAGVLLFVPGFSGWYAGALLTTTHDP